MKAHDVRHLTPCEGCRLLGDDRDMIVEQLRFRGERTASQKVKDNFRIHWHGKCFERRHGRTRLLGLGRKQLERLRLSDVGVEVMTAIVAKLTPNANSTAKTDG